MTKSVQHTLQTRFRSQLKNLFEDVKDRVIDTVAIIVIHTPIEWDHIPPHEARKGGTFRIDGISLCMAEVRAINRSHELRVQRNHRIETFAPIGPGQLRVREGKQMVGARVADQKGEPLVVCPYGHCAPSAFPRVHEECAGPLDRVLTPGQ